MSAKDYLSKPERKKAKEFRKNRKGKRDRWNTGKD